MQDAATRTSLRRDLLLLALLLAIGAAVKGRVWHATSVLTRDGIGFIEFASRLQQEPLPEVLRDTVQHPLYPLCIYAVSRVQAQFVDRPLTCYDWEFCAHLANVAAGLLLIVPMYFLGRRLGGRAVGFGAALLFQVLPVPVHVTADTLSEGTYLLCAALSLWAGVAGLDSRRLSLLLLAGACGGLAYLTRPEGALLPLCLVLTLLGLRWRGCWAMSWPRVAAAVASVGAATVLVVAPYCLTIGQLSPKGTFKHMLPQVALPQAPTGGGMLLGIRFQSGVDGNEYDVTLYLVTREISKELLKAFHYFLWLPALFGLGLLCRRMKTDPQDASLALLLLVCAGNVLILFWLAWRAHYVSERHTMLVVLTGCWPALLALQAGAEWLCDRCPSLHGRATPVLGCALALLAGIGLVTSLRGLHEHRLGHRLAGEWLATQWHPGDLVVDPYGWVSYYAGQRTPPHKPDPDAKGRLFLVLEPGEKDAKRKELISRLDPRRPKHPKFAWPAWTDHRLEVYEIPPPVSTALKAQASK